MIKSLKAKWVDHLINLLVVILGITIAYMLNNWAEKNRERKISQVYLGSLVSDIDKDLERLKFSRDTLEHFLRWNEKLTQVIIERDFSNDSLFYYVMSLSLGLSKVFVNDNTYRTLQSSGNFHLIGDFELRKHITDLYNLKYRELEFIESMHRDFTYKELSTYINKNIRFTGNPEIVNKDFLKDIYFVNLAFSSKFVMDGKLSAYDSVISKAQFIKKIIIENQ